MEFPSFKCFACRTVHDYNIGVDNRIIPDLGKVETTQIFPKIS